MLAVILEGMTENEYRLLVDSVRILTPTIMMVKSLENPRLLRPIKIFSSTDMPYDVYLVYCVLARTTQLQTDVKMTSGYWV